jgi:putative NIF3 family GTP cyclohydrolase 1 type 2
VATSSAAQTQQTPPKQAQQANAFMRMPQHTGPITALQFIQRIRKNAAVPSSVEAVDYVVAGDPTTAVTGIATMAIASIDSLKAAAASGKNLIVTLEPTFWADNDNLDRFEGNTLFKFKRDFIRSNNLVCFHLHEDWPSKVPDGIAVGMSKEFGWDSYVVDPANATSFKLPSTTLLALAQELSKKLDDRTMRVVGDPKLPVSNVAAKWGNATQMPAIHLLNTPVDVVIVGYTHEWEAVEYAQDMISAGQKKGLILLGESKSEQAGMKYCAEWLKTFITEVPVEYIPVSEPYWNLSGK